MSLNTVLDRNANALFHHGLTPQIKCILFVVLSFCLMIFDHRLGVLAYFRSTIATALLPFQHVTRVPIKTWIEIQQWFMSHQDLLAANEKFRQQIVSQSFQITQARQLELENQRLRALLNLGSRSKFQSLTAEVIHQFPTQFHHQKWLINRGSIHGVSLGAPVLIESGLVGQVTRSHPFSAEVTLLNDKSISIPVVNVRTQELGIAIGDSSHRSDMILKFTTASADIKIGDLLQTSGLDGVYPAGIAVAKVVDINRNVADVFTQIRLRASAELGFVKHILILQPSPANSPHQ